MDFDSEAIEQSKLLTEWRGDLTVHNTNGTEQTWQRQRPIGEGGFGTVWLEARHDEIKKKRAVKEVKRDTLVRFNIDYRRELLALVKLSASGFQDKFVEFYGWFQDRTFIYYAMEYFVLGDLDQHLACEIQEDAANQITHQILLGLAIMHKNSFTHRDLKPKARLSDYITDCP